MAQQITPTSGTNMAKPWAEVANSEGYKSLAPDQQEAARNQYFDQVVAPRAPQDKLSEVRAQFDTATKSQAAPQPSIEQEIAAGRAQALTEGTLSPDGSRVVRPDGTTIPYNVDVAPAENTQEPAKKLRLPAKTESIGREAIRSMLRGATVGASDVLGAAGGAAGYKGLEAVGLVPESNQSFGDMYNEMKTKQSQQRDVFREEQPALAYGSEIAGAVAPALLTMGASAPATTAQTAGLGARVLKGAAIGAAQGGLYGGSQAEVGNELQGAGEGAAVGAAFGGALPVIGSQVKKAVGALLPKNVLTDAVKKEAAEQVASGNMINNITVQLQRDGIDFNALAPQAKQDIIDYAAKATMTGADDVISGTSAMGRKGVLDTLPQPIQATRGTLSKDYIQQQKEGLIADSSILGKDVADRLRSYAPKLTENLEAIKTRTGGKMDDLYNAGTSLRNAVESRASESKSKISQAYKQAENEAGGLPTQVSDDVIGWIGENAGFDAVKQLLPKAKALGIIAEQKLDDGTSQLVAQPTTFKKLYELRRAATNLQKSSDGTIKHYAGEFKGMVDDIFETEGGQLYKDAARLRRQHALQYESGPKVIRDVLKLRAGSETDKAIANEDLFTSSIIRGSADDVKKLYGFLSKDKQYRAEGIQQIKDLRSMAIEQLKQQATQGQSGLTSAAWNKALRNMGGREKLEAVFGKSGYAELQNFSKAADILLNKEKPTLGGSQTASRMAMMFDGLVNTLGKIPVIGAPVEAGGKVLKVTANALGAKNAMLPPDAGISEKALQQARNKLLSAPSNALTSAALASQRATGGEQ